MTNFETLWLEFIQYGSGFFLEGDRDYKAEGAPLVYRLKVFGLHYPDN